MIVEALWRDVKFGLRLLRERGFTLTALLTLALAIEANTAVFTVLHSVAAASLLPSLRATAIEAVTSLRYE